MAELKTKPRVEAPAAPVAALPKRTGRVTWDQAILSAADEWPLRLVELAEKVASERAGHEHRLAAIGERVAEIEPRITALGPQSAEHAELSSERGALLSRRREAEVLLAALDAALSPAEAERRAGLRARREAYVRVRCREAAQDIARAAENFSTQGDHRNAAVWRREMLTVRERVEGEVR